MGGTPANGRGIARGHNVATGGLNAPQAGRLTTPVKGPRPYLRDAAGVSVNTLQKARRKG
jgi:hypothetical protein